MKQIKILAELLWYSLPVQLLLNHFKRNQMLLLWWVFLFAIISGNFGNYLGVPYLFLDPVYLDDVGFFSFLAMGAVFAGLSMIFHITSYILDGPRFSFIGTVSQPFFTFSVNNSLIPLSFMIAYMVLVVQYQITNEFTEGSTLLIYILGIITGFSLMTIAFYVYIRFTNKDIFRYVVCKVDEKLKENITVTRASAMKKLQLARKRQLRVDTFIDRNFDFRKVPNNEGFYDKATILQVFDQNHLNLVTVELVLFLILLFIGVFNDYPVFQIPAAASTVILITIFVMFTGAFSYWFGSWAGTAALVLLFVVNFMVQQNVLEKTYKAYGLNYSVEEKPVYSDKQIRSMTKPAMFRKDSLETVEILNNWRAKFNRPPKMIFVCVSGGGQRAALWSYNVLDEIDHQTSGKFMEQTMLITGASGGLIGAAYFRELIYQQKIGQLENRDDPMFREQLGRDNLNAVIFSFLMNDLFSGWRKFEYGGYRYARDRGFSFEEQLNKNTGKLFDKSLHAFKEPEQQALIPMMILAPTIVNDGRKLYISPQHISYMVNPVTNNYPEEKVTGIEFQRFFESVGGEDLRFLSALRMNATFPYITPNVTLPSEPALEIMDAGVNDNFGISDAVRFMFVFREWIARNTSGVLLISIRDSDKNPEVLPRNSLSLFDRITLPISTIYQNFESMQDITNDTQVEYANSWMKVPFDRIDIQYIPDELSKENLSVADSLRMENAQRASLSWRLTQREKESLLRNLQTEKNRNAFLQIRSIVQEGQAN
ncbi:patatin-like phospholipase family protein [Fulvivirga sedimenti]|uniref:Patatin-like phospholipase family protein n=1 Tax=Fulvivirga sedimenti TaxID=2879465 RepID=A0A9X1HQK3_9BACT|nr:patatin-like phospholipase family protein [Fulvivirga sedimenti]MCA6075336.1 patatin-like phospholipase family protein [Fulvivirga sedimenti]MCA6076513.1 patatin-like phospholipase family protein [Fulvivirga sedimenti]MCA6077641.1 patatin-like phospholipase family protein [Fulvivirga sedimenti]